MTKRDISLASIAEMMEELAAYTGQTIVIKIGGNSIDEDPDFLPSLARQLEFLQSRRLKIVLVHGGGPQIDRALAEAGMNSVRGPDGRRLTSPEMMEIISGTMAKISLAIAKELRRAGCDVFVAADSKSRFVEARPLFSASARAAENDRTGMPSRVDSESLRRCLDKGKIVVLSSVGRGVGGNDYNINADDFATAVAVALAAKRLMLATNVSGVYDSNKNLMESLSAAGALELISEGIISGGMVPKVESALRAIEGGVDGVAIINAHTEWALLGEIMTRKGFGTLVKSG